MQFWFVKEGKPFLKKFSESSNKIEYARFFCHVHEGGHDTHSGAVGRPSMVYLGGEIFRLETYYF